MHKSLVLIFTIVSIFIGASCTPKNFSYKTCTDIVFSTLETMPEYEGGIEKLIDDLNKRIHLKENVNGRVVVLFIVNCEGKAFGFTVPQTRHPLVYKKIVTSFYKLQNWKPGLRREQPEDCHESVHLEITKGIIGLDPAYYKKNPTKKELNN